MILDTVKRWAEAVGDLINDWLISPVLEVVDAAMERKPWGFAALLGLVVLGALFFWGLSSLAGGLAAPLGDFLHTLASWMPGSSLVLALFVFLGTVCLATLPLRLSHTRVDQATGEQELWLDDSGLPTRKSMALRIGFALADGVLLFLVASAVEGAPRETQQWLVFPGWGALFGVIFATVAVALQSVVANILAVLVDSALIGRARRQMGKLGPTLSARTGDDNVFGVVLINMLIDALVLLPALVGLCIVYRQNPFCLTIVAIFLALKIPETVVAQGASVCLDWWHDSREYGGS